MQTILPAGYSFTLDKLVNSQLREHIAHPTQYIFLLGILVIISIFFIVNCWALFADYRHKDDTVRHRFIFEASFITIITVLYLTGIYIAMKNELYDQYTTAFFEYPIKSNLQVHTVNQKYSPKTINDHSKKPYKLYTNKKVYLGKIIDGKFISTDNEASTIFYQYHMYVMKHHLAKKFSKQIVFKKDKHYHLIDNHHAQWVLTNNNDLVLHLDKNFHVTESKMIKD